MPKLDLARRLRAVTIPAVAVALLGGPGGAAAEAPDPRPAQPAGWRYAFTVEREREEPVRGVALVSGERTRIELLGKEGRSSSSYLLVTDGGRTLVSVDPSKREYWQTDAAGFERIVGTAMEAVGRAVTIDVRDLDVVGRRLGAGERIAEHDTQRGRLSATYAMRMGVLGFNTTARHRVDVDYWTAPALRLPRNPVLELFAALPTALAQGDADFATRLRAGREALVGGGTPLRVEVTAVHTEDDGREKRERTVIAVSDVARASHDAALFQVPDGYRKREGFSFSM